MDNISVMICDDSALMRNLIGRIIEDVNGFSVAGKAENGLDLLEKLPACKPDIILLDIEMPKMNGVEFLKKRKELGIKIPVIILSSVATEGAAVTMECLELGASDFITKPGGTSVTLRIGDVSSNIIEFIASYGRIQAFKNGKKVPDADFYVQQAKLKEAQRVVAQKKGEEAAKKAAESLTELLPAHWTAPKKKEPVVIVPEEESGNIEIIAIGISTGGPNALRDMCKLLDKNIKQPILIVQHMPAGFTKEFAESLNNICPLTVSEAVDGEPLLPGHVYVAPGSYHMYVERRALANVIRTSQTIEPRNGHRPSADVLFESIAHIYRNKSLGVIMTGMGRDGAAELANMRKKGARTLGQDEASSIVYGMPKVAWELGGVQKQVSLENMANEINTLALTYHN